MSLNIRIHNGRDRYSRSN